MTGSQSVYFALSPQTEILYEDHLSGLKHAKPIQVYQPVLSLTGMGEDVEQTSSLSAGRGTMRLLLVICSEFWESGAAHWSRISVPTATWSETRRTDKNLSLPVSLEMPTHVPCRPERGNSPFCLDRYQFEACLIFTHPPCGSGLSLPSVRGELQISLLNADKRGCMNCPFQPSSRCAANLYLLS